MINITMDTMGMPISMGNIPKIKIRYAALCLIGVSCILSVMVVTVDTDKIMNMGGMLSYNDNNRMMGSESSPPCQLYWRDGRLHGDPLVCETAEPPRDIPQNVLLVGDSVTRYLYFGLVQTLCTARSAANKHDSCPGLPKGGLAHQQGCRSHTTVDDVTHHHVTYRRENFGTNPLDVVTPDVDVVYWQIGLWMKAKGLSDEEQREEYGTVIRAAQELCQTHKIRKFFVAETMTNPGGTKGNIHAEAMNANLHASFDALVPSEERGGCVRLYRTTWPTDDWTHIRPDDLLHPTIQATVFFAGAVWAALNRDKDVHRPTTTTTNNDFLVPDDTMLDDTPPELKGDWCKGVIQYLQ